MLRLIRKSTRDIYNYLNNINDVRREGGNYMPFEIVRNDITNMQVDVIVNAANSELMMGGGVCGAIYRAAGEKALTKACSEIAHCHVGDVVMTPAFNLDAACIIHTVGPIWQGGTHNEALLLKSCYQRSLSLAVEKGFDSIAFPLLSSGIYGYPKNLALKIAIHEIGEFLLQNDLKQDLMVYLVVYDQQAISLSEKLYTSITKYIDDHYVEEREQQNNHRSRKVRESRYLEEVKMVYAESSLLDAEMPKAINKRRLEDVVGELDESFSVMLLRLIDERGLTDVESYKKANVDRRLFSKIRNRSDYTPSRVTAIAFAIALELDLDTTKDLLSKAGYTLSRSHKFDVIIEYFIEAGIYNIFEINEALFNFDQTLLGA